VPVWNSSAISVAAAPGFVTASSSRELGKAVSRAAVTDDLCFVSVDQNVWYIASVLVHTGQHLVSSARVHPYTHLIGPLDTKGAGNNSV
jgi:hypothetical protein